MAGLTTHVLDTSIGKPAHNILIELFFLNNEVKNKILECTTYLLYTSDAADE